MSLPLFTDTEHCKCRAHCGTCRLKEAGRGWRNSLSKAFSLPNGEIDFECPYGVDWKEEKPISENSPQLEQRQQLQNQSLPATSRRFSSRSMGSRSASTGSRSADRKSGKCVPCKRHRPS